MIMNFLKELQEIVINFHLILNLIGLIFQILAINILIKMIIIMKMMIMNMTTKIINILVIKIISI